MFYNATTLTDNQTTVDNSTLSSNNHTTYNATTPSNIPTTSNNNTTLYNATTLTDSKAKVINVTTTSNNNTMFYSTTTPSDNHTTVYNATTPSKNYTTPSNPTATSSNNTTFYNPTSNNNTTVYNATTPSNSPTTTSNNHTTFYNATTSNNNTTPANPSISNNITTPSNPITSNNNTTPANPSISNNNTTPSKPTTSNNNITPSNASISNNNTTPANPSISNNNITPSKPTTTSNNNKAHYNATTPSYLMQHNTTTTSNIHTTVQTSSSRYLPESNATTTSSSYVADHQVTTRNNHMTAYEATQASINLTTLHKPNTSSNNYTTNRNMATIGSNFTNMYDTTPNHDFTTASPNNNTTSKVVAVHNTTKRDDSSSLYTTTKSPITYTTATEPPHKATTLSYMTTAPVVEPQQSTTSAKSTAVAAAMTKVTSTTHPHFTAESRTSVPDNRKPTDQTENQTTVSATPLTTVHKNDSSSTAVVTTIEENEPLSYNSATPVIAATATPSTTAHNPTNKIITTTEVSQKTTLPTIKTTTSTVARTGTTLTTTVKWLSEDMSKLNSSQVSKLVDDLEEILSGPTVSQSVGQNVLNVINNLINGDPEVLSGSTNSLIRMVDTLALKLEFAEDVGILSSDSLVLAVRKVDWTDFLETSVEIFDIDDVQLQHVRRVKRSAPALGSVGLPSSVTSGLSPEEKQQASRVQFTFYKNNFLFKDSSLDNQTAVSPVLGSSVANLSISNLQENVTFTINHSNLTQNNVTSCVFWNFTKKNGLGGWDDTGCSVVSATPEYTTCSCNHLTSFAILLDLSREGISDPQQAKILTFITYIGCGISAVFLAVTLITYMLFEKLLRDIPAKILVQLCLSLLLLNLVFLLDGWLSNYENVNLCISTAFFLHYFLLSSFTWAGLEALHMYLSIVRVFAPYLSKYMLKFSLMGWGIPLFVVVVIVAVDKNNYGLVPNGKYEDGTSDKFCWLRNDIAFYVGVVAYFLLIFVLCLAVFIVVMVQLARIKKQNPHNQSPNRSTMTDIRSIIGLVLLLGLTWGFALFAWGEARLAFLYMFTICNSLLGLFVFIFHCVVKENVRRMWRTFLCCGNWRLSENSECSRTATHNKLSVVATATTSANQHSNLSSSFGSNVTSSSSSVFWDSGISDRSSSDIVLNEARRQSQSLQGEP
ncbi:PREDICTED: adhesion G-protein coupled receptor G2-like isoform X2 [Poecilia mexicana]|uniref:adhesion G-protein coupled receptor G2-like isoform X2 n=1 Tax=Poecilia mexicana TaxID=48701 RepID=UPI00072DBC38|nr:PREDICTED: adhesion G-protein coupled receptor G2-like isoform X2 [Poecilia mexicana]